MKLVNLLNLVSRKRTKPITTAVLHATAGKSASSSISWLKQIGLSYHCVIGDGTGKNEIDGTVYKCVPDMRVAFHAGVSKGPSGSNCNDYSLGLSFACMDDRVDKITKAQYAAAVERCVQWASAYPELKWITTHALVSPGRKVDPRGPVEGKSWNGKFPLDEFVIDVNLLLESSGSNKRCQSWEG